MNVDTKGSQWNKIRHSSDDGRWDKKLRGPFNVGNTCHSLLMFMNIIYAWTSGVKVGDFGTFLQLLSTTSWCGKCIRCKIVCSNRPQERSSLACIKNSTICMTSMITRDPKPPSGCTLILPVSWINESSKIVRNYWMMKVWSRSKYEDFAGFVT